MSAGPSFEPSLIFDQTFWVVMLLFIGPCLGSFASAIIHRSRTGQSWIFAPSSAGTKSARSACPHCGGQLRWFDLLPILSWVFLRGRCRMCKAGISAFYPLLELAALVMCQALYWCLGPSIETAIAVSTVPFVLTLLVMSWQGDALPSDVLAVLLGLALGQRAVEALYAPETLKVLGDGLMGAALFMGAGALLGSIRSKLLGVRYALRAELPLLATMGVWFGVTLLPVVLIIAGVYGVLVAVARMLAGLPKQTGMTHPYISAFFISLLFGEKILGLLMS